VQYAMYNRLRDNLPMTRVKFDPAFSGASVGDLCHDGLGSGIGAFLAWTEYITKTKRKGGRRELNLVVGCAGEVHTMQCIFSRLYQGSETAT